MTSEEQDRSKRELTDLYGRTAEQYDRVIPYFETFGRCLVRVAGIPRGARVLDVACGRGACLLPAVKAAGAEGHVDGIDLSEPMLAALRAELDERGVTTAHLHRMDAEELTFDDDVFDAVTCGFAIFLLPDPEAALPGFGRVLQPGGTIAASTFTEASGWPWLRAVFRELLPNQDVRPTPDHPLATAAGLRGAFEAAGFRDVTTSTMSQRFVFADLDAVMAWLASHSARAALERLDDRDERYLRTSLREHLDADHRAAGGGYELDQSADLTTAVV